MESSNEHLFKVPIIKISQKSKLHATIKLKTGSSHCLTSRLPHEIQLQTQWKGIHGEKDHGGGQEVALPAGTGGL